MAPLSFELGILLIVIAFLQSSQQVVADVKSQSMILQDSIVEEVNANPKAGWIAGKNHRFTNHTVEQFKHMLGMKPKPPNFFKDIPIRSYSEYIELPKQFDARSAWPQCKTIGNILDQGHCGSCWAFGAVESLQDRFCIQNGLNVSLSVNDLLACCPTCGDCDGGFSEEAWTYFVESGVVTDECDPYFDPSGCSHPGCSPGYPTPDCVKQCKDHKLDWNKNKHFSVNSYRVSSDPNDIMMELYQNGPIEVSFIVYEDFAHYKSGVYHHITGDALGGHAVKLIGWGTSDDGVDYWLLANEWNKSWGDNGFFMIRRGNNECGIEDDGMAGMPSSNDNIIRNYGGSDADAGETF